MQLSCSKIRNFCGYVSSRHVQDTAHVIVLFPRRGSASFLDEGFENSVWLGAVAPAGELGLPPRKQGDGRWWYRHGGRRWQGHATATNIAGFHLFQPHRARSGL